MKMPTLPLVTASKCMHFQIKPVQKKKNDLHFVGAVQMLQDILAPRQVNQTIIVSN